MEQLNFAIREAGGVTALAAALGIAQPRVSNWLARGSVPDGWLALLRVRFPMQQAQEKTPAPTH